VNVDVAEGREVEHPLRDDSAIAYDNDGIGLSCDELAAEFFVGLDALRLTDGEIQFERGLLDRGDDELEAAPFGAIGLRDDEVDVMSGGDQRFERWYGEARGSAENEGERHLIIE
jgi:hypothetical protein